jgi:hypothetical protein
MDLTKKSKSELITLCKEKNVKSYSGKNKDDIIKLLIQAGVEHVLSEKKLKVVKEKKVTAPRFEKMDKKLAKFITLDKYKNSLSKYDENIDDKTILSLVSNEFDNFINSLEDIDHKKFVEAYGTVKLLVEYYISTSNKKIITLSETEILKTLSVFLFKKDTDVLKTLISKVVKYIKALIKIKEKEIKKEKDEKEKEEKIIKAKNSKSLKEDDDVENEPESDSDSDSESNNSKLIKSSASVNVNVEKSDVEKSDVEKSDVKKNKKTKKVNPVESSEESS